MSGTEMVAPTLLGNGTSLAPSFTSATAISTLASTRSNVRVDKVCAPEDPKRRSSDLVIAVAELIQEPTAE